ncbi:hypothetical protein GCM10023093_12000 [Nemorincola caseinilytica]|uniref:Fatty acid hydroxylase domain-containing protein n=1 Tax=Nemorincola caseinilytica TaxID=2054315 RepID=A0ABP8NCV4_9BACT
MHFDKINNKGQARLFEHNTLEMLTRTHPLVIYSIYLPVIGFMLYHSVANIGTSLGITLAIFSGGILFWTLFEYAMHRYLFHMVANSVLGRRIIYTMHGVHHEYPRDKGRLFMPPLPSVVISGIIFGVMYLCIGNYAFALFPGFILGYLLYASMHYAIHAFAPPRFLKALWRNHHLHHYKEPDAGFGVSSVLWDVVFGTVPEKEERTTVVSAPRSKIKTSEGPHTA